MANAKVEVAVLLVQRWIVARLRNRRFFSLEELNAAIRDEVGRLKARVSRHLGASRQQLFETLDCPAMQPLPPEPFVHADWRRATVGVDYHVRLEGHHYSVPHELIRQPLWARLAAGTVEIFRAGKRVACHRRAAPGDTGATTGAFRDLNRLANAPERSDGFSENTFGLFRRSISITACRIRSGICSNRSRVLNRFPSKS